MPNPKQQKRPVSAPLASDTTLRDFSGNIQDNLRDLWTLSHGHTVSTSTKASYAALTTDADRVAFIATFLGLQ